MKNTKKMEQSNLYWKNSIKNEAHNSVVEKKKNKTILVN